MPKKSLFIELLGDSPSIKVLDYLLTERELDFSISDMARNAGIGRATLYRIWDQLIKNKIIIHTRTSGKSKLYKLNIENPKIKKLMEIDDMLILEELRNKAGKHKVEVTVWLFRTRSSITSLEEKWGFYKDYGFRYYGKY